MIENVGGLFVKGNIANSAVDDSGLIDGKIASNQSRQTVLAPHLLKQNQEQ